MLSSPFDLAISVQPPQIKICIKNSGGWMLVYVSNSNSITNSNLITNSNVNSCILSSNYATICTQQTWQNTQIKATSYMKKLPTGDKLIAIFNTSMNWIDLAIQLPTSTYFKYTYLASNTNIHYLGYGIDSSSASGCQDSATQTNVYYPFGLGLGNSQCNDSGTNTVLFDNSTGQGVYISGSWGHKEGIWVR